MYLYVLVYVGQAWSQELPSTIIFFRLYWFVFKYLCMYKIVLVCSQYAYVLLGCVRICQDWYVI